MLPITVTKTLTSLDRDGICTAQVRTGAGDLTIDGALASGGVATLDTQRIVGIYSAGNLSALTFTVYGTDGNGSGAPISEALAGPNNNTVSTTLNFKTVTRVAVSGTIGTNVEVGTTGVGATQPVPLEQRVTPFDVALALEFAGTANATVQTTQDNVFDPDVVRSATGVTWTNITALAAKTSYTESALSQPYAAVRLLINSGTDAVKLIVRQAGSI